MKLLLGEDSFLIKLSGEELNTLKKIIADYENEGEAYDKKTYLNEVWPFIDNFWKTVR
jgi:hypothetical protein